MAVSYAGQESRRDRGWQFAFLLWVCSLCLPAPGWAARSTVAPLDPPPSSNATITKLRIGSFPAYTRVVLDAAEPLEWSVLEKGAEEVRVVIPGGVLARTVLPIDLRKGIVRAIRPTQRPGGVELRLILQQHRVTVRSFSLTDPDRIVIDVVAGSPGDASDGPNPRDTYPSSRPAPGALDSSSRAQRGPSTEGPSGPVPSGTSGEVAKGPNGHGAAPPLEPAKETPRRDPPIPTKEPASGPVTVVLDPGHGGHDTGAMGPTGLMEKEVVLDLALRLRLLLQERLGIRVIMTRDEDVFVPLQERSAIANRAKADFFISLHVNGSSRRGAVGFETFYFTREASDNDARASAQRENLVIERDGTTGKDLESLLRMTLADMAVTRDIRESGEMAELALSSLDKIMKVENRGVKSGPFYVLATVAMPAVLVESAFITNPREERKLQQDQYRQRIAEALCEGIGKYKARYERRVGLRDGLATAAGL
jgi:N-acetylmuramoyl-L-alanine amidase